jgi:hypothetical protein
MITQEELKNLLCLVITATTYRDELVHRVNKGARIERGTWTLRQYSQSYPGEPLVIPTLDSVLDAINELEAGEENETCRPPSRAKPH